MAIELTEQEKASLLEGERITQAEEANAERTYTEAREQSEAELRFAGKFRTAEDLEKAYLELQKKLGAPKEDPAAETSEEPEAESPAPEATAEEAPEPKEEAPASPPVQEAPVLAPEAQKAILEAVGGQQTYEAALEWATENFSEAEQQAYDRVLATGDPNVIQFAAEALVNRYQANADFQGQMVRGRGGGDPGAKPFRSRAEVASAMADSRYHNDPAYRNDVADRLAVSPDDLL